MMLIYFLLQGAQTTYHAVLKPVLANISNKQVSSTTASADGLRDRVHTATSEL